MNLRKKTNSRTVTPMRLLSVGVATALALLAGACASTEPVSLENLGLAIEVDIQAGASFEVAVPVDPTTSVRVDSAPPGVTAGISEDPNGDLMLLAVAVEPDTPRGTYNLALIVTRDGAVYETGWPFDVVEPLEATSATETTATTQQASVAALLTVDTPQIGDVFTSDSVLRGQTSSPTVGYRLLAAGDDTVLAEGTVSAINGVFSAEVEFANTCCVEMVLDVFQPSTDGLALIIPLTHPEPG